MSTTTTTSAAPGAAPRLSVRHLLARFQELPALVICAVAVIYFAVTQPTFTTGNSLTTLITFVAPIAIIAAGLVPLMIAGEMDVSVGQTFALAPIVLALCVEDGMPLAVALVVGLVAAGLAGALSGVLTTYLRVSSFIVTLGMYFLINGINLVLSDGRPFSTPGEGTYETVMGGGAYSQLLWGLVLVLVLHFVLVKTRSGMHTVAVGANPTGAVELGIRVRRVKIRAFVLSALLAGLAGVFEAVRVHTTEPLAGGSSTTFYAIAAVVMGGTLLTGGKGTVIGALLGALFLGVVRQGFTLAGVSAYSFDLIVGVAILVAMAVNAAVLRYVTPGGRS